MLKVSTVLSVKFHGMGKEMGDTILKTTHVSSPLANVFAISRGAKTHAETVRVSLQRGDVVGRGECVPYPRYGETPAGVIDTINTFWAEHGGNIDREALQILMPAGAARCAIDCALWDMEAKETGKPVWQLADLPEPKPIETAVTVSLAAPEEMAKAAQAITGKLLKLKLGGPEDIARIEAVHTARPDARLIVDANEGLSPDTFPALASQAAELGVILIEQPFPADKDDALLKRPAGIAICADESAHTSADIPHLAKRYDAVNVKLDKTGGLTEAIKMVKAAQAYNMQIMVGCMVAGSLSMAPAVLLSGLANVADVDGPLWLANDIEHGLHFDAGMAHPPSPALWG